MDWCFVRKTAKQWIDYNWIYEYFQFKFYHSATTPIKDSVQIAE